MFGFLNLDKPAGWSSREVVDRVQRAVRPLKVGHAGTLDPLATGVLVVGIGPATRLTEHVQRHPKGYDATFLLGKTSTTEDTEGEVEDLPGAPRIEREQIEAALPQFLGRISQVPPAFSALKVDGRRAYKLARRGQSVQLAARLIDIFRLEVLEFEYPRLRLRIACGSGTYVRSLGRDLARAVGTDAVMTALRREWIGPFSVEQAIPGDMLDAALIQIRLISPLLALAPCQRRLLTDDEEVETRHGRYIPRGSIDLPGEWSIDSSPKATAPATTLVGERTISVIDSTRVAVDHQAIAGVNRAGTLVALLRPREPDQLGPLLVFPSPDSPE